MSRLYLVRHGQTVFNVRHLIQGWCDSPLTDFGIKQAEVAREWIESQGLVFDHAYCSTLERTSDTVEILTRNSLPYGRMKDLRELNFGVLEGCTQDLLPVGDVSVHTDFAKQFGGETMDEVGERMSACLTEIMRRPDHESVLAVTHGACALAFNRVWLDHAEKKVDFIPSNCAVYTFEFDADTGVFSCVDLYQLPGEYFTNTSRDPTAG